MTIRSSMTPKAERTKIQGMKNDRGGAAIWVILVVLLVGGFVGFRIGQLYFDNSTLENEVAVLGDNTLLSRDANSEKVKAEINKLLARYDVQVDPQDITIEFNGAGDRLNIKFYYRRPADLVVLHPGIGFEVAVQREARRAVGIIQNVQESIEDSNAAAARKYKDAVKNATGQPPE